MEISSEKIIATYNQKLSSSENPSDSMLDAGGAITNLLYDYYSRYYIKKQCNFKPHHRVLDFGCGVGRLTIPFAKYVASIDGIDISNSLIEFAKNASKDVPNVNFRCIQPNESISEKYDVIYLFGVMIHFSDEALQKLVSNFKECLNAGGRIVFIEPTYPVKTQVSDEVIYRTVDDFKFAFKDFKCLSIKPVLRNPSYSFHLLKKIKLQGVLFLNIYRKLEELTLNRKPEHAVFLWHQFVYVNEDGYCR